MNIKCTKYYYGDIPEDKGGNSNQLNQHNGGNTAGKED